MQNYNNPAPPPGGYGTQPPKRGMSTGVKVLIVVVILLVVGTVALLAVGGGVAYWLSRRANEAASTYPNARPGLSNSSSSSSTAGDDAQPPQPTADQSAAIAGGQAANWAQQEISWTVPQRWKQDSADSNSFMWSSPGSADAAHMIVSVSAMGSDFPTETSLKAYYDGFQSDKANGKYDEVRWLKLDGVKGIVFRQTSPEKGDDIQRLEWIGYRKYKGQSQQVTIILSTLGKYFARHEDAMYGILYSTKMTK
jgi:hypothetical protein